MNRLSCYLLLFVCCGIWSGSVAAHSLKLFASAEGAKVQGYAYFPGGAVAQQMPITVQVAGQTVATLTTDATGQFHYTAQQPVAHLFRANAGIGHVAQFQLTAEALGGVAATGQAAETAVAANSTTSTCSDSSTAQQFTAIQAQLTALQQQLVAYETKTRWHEVLGGLGYILGLAGLWLWLQQRRE